MHWNGIICIIGDQALDVLGEVAMRALHDDRPSLSQRLPRRTRTGEAPRPKTETIALGDYHRERLGSYAIMRRAFWPVVGQRCLGDTRPAGQAWR
jgi:hypothetical protein